MANVVINSNDPICQSAGNWFRKNMKCLEANKISQLTANDTLYIIAHDNELNDGRKFIEWVKQFGRSKEQHKIVLIVCSAASYEYAFELKSPAEMIANHYQLTVHASKSIVWGKWDDHTGARFTGNYIAIKPNSDVESMFKNLTIK